MQPDLRSKSSMREACGSPEQLLGILAGVDVRGPKPAAVSGSAGSLPLLLISQLPRSGGSLLSQLLDAHPEVLAYPGELKIGWPSKSEWPTLDRSEPPSRLFATLYHWHLAAMARDGYLKVGQVRQKVRGIPFDYSPVAHAEAFLAAMAAAPPADRARLEDAGWEA